MNLGEYERAGVFLYGEFANAVASILDTAIERSVPPYRCQPIQRRAKAVESLQHKLMVRGKLESDSIEEYIKDLAGCRLIFYTNSEVERFKRSGILAANFEIDYKRTKAHHPVPGHSDNEFRSDNIVLRLKDDRALLITAEKYTELVSEILSRYRYQDIEGTLDSIFELYPGALTEGEGACLLNLTTQLAEHNLEVWKQAGAYVQMN